LPQLARKPLELDDGLLGADDVSRLE